MTFSVTPVLFNVGINENATVAGSVPGGNAPQDKNNADNFKILQEYHRRFRKLGLPTSQTLSGREKREFPDFLFLKNYCRKGILF